MNKKGLLVGLIAAAAMFLAGQAHAEVITSTASFTAVLIKSAPATGKVSVIKSVTVANSSANNACAYFYDGITSGAVDATKLKLTICVPAGQTVTWPPVATVNSANSGTPGAASAFLGEDLKISNALYLNTGVVDSSKLVSNVTTTLVQK